MKLLPVRALACSLVASFIVAGCQSRSDLLGKNADWEPPPFVTPKAPPTMALHFPPLPDLELGRLDGDAFIPPGATVIWPDPRVTVEVRLTPKGKYPSTAESVALDNNAVVGSRSAQEADHLQHWLRIYRRGDTQARSIFQTDHSWETLWSYDSRAVAISHFTGKNTAEVLVYRFGDEGGAKAVDVREVLKPYLTEEHLAAPVFRKAYRWGDGSQLIVRGMGRLAAEPYDLFGYEVLVDAAAPQDPGRMRFMRAYTKAAPKTDRSRFTTGRPIPNQPPR